MPLWVRSERHAGVLGGAQGLVQVRVIEDVPEPSYDLSISLRLIRNHMLDRPQDEGEQRVAAIQQSRS